ncbi:MAG TPA: tetratricopeptide repeat protein [Chlorobaculum sp.]|nr:tetratricopeptide repeat protein [Chlorobaculum sp.]
MTYFRSTISALLLVVFSLVLSQRAFATTADDDANAANELNAGVVLVKAKQPAQALEHFDKVISNFESRYHDSSTTYYSARTDKEKSYYQLNAPNPSKTVVLSSDWAYGYYYKSYSLTELGRVPEAITLLQKALSMSPQNAQFMEELGYHYQNQKNWAAALDLFKKAEFASKEFTPQEYRNAELARAWRGIGYVYVEYGRLDEATAIYRQCLELNANDEKAKGELEYIDNLKGKTPARK